jgi:hypothetical protein
MSFDSSTQTKSIRDKEVFGEVERGVVVATALDLFEQSACACGRSIVKLNGASRLSRTSFPLPGTPC